MSTQSAPQKQTPEQALSAANQGFYAAFESLDIERMASVWAHDDDVQCVHPGWDLLIGWEEISERWARIFAKAKRVKIALSSVWARVEGNAGWVACTEHVTTAFALAARRAPCLAPAYCALGNRAVREPGDPSRSARPAAMRRWERLFLTSSPRLKAGDSCGRGDLVVVACFGGFLPQPPYFSGGLRRGFTFCVSRSRPLRAIGIYHNRSLDPRPKERGLRSLLVKLYRASGGVVCSYGL
jgi:SnoaL-like domain